MKKLLLVCCLGIFGSAMALEEPAANAKPKESINANSQQRMEERQNNSSIIIDSNRETASDGRGTTLKDIRPQGKKYHKDQSDLEVKYGD